MFRLLLALVAATVAASALGDDPIYQVSYEITHVGESIDSPVVLMRSGKSGSVVIGGTRDTLLEIYSSAIELADRIDISVEVRFEKRVQELSGTVTSGDVVKLGFDDLEILLTVEEWTDGAT
ncbi:MAG: hypothetical protein AAFR91_12790 [Pseudomonadota bacterium]